MENPNLENSDKDPEEGQILPPEGESSEIDPRKEIVGSILLIIVGLIFVIKAFEVPFNSNLWVAYSSPTIFPLIMALFLVITSSSVLIRSIKRWSAQKAILPEIKIVQSMKEWGAKNFLIGTGIIILYLLLLGKVNFFLLSAAEVLAFGIIFRQGKISEALKLSGITAIIIIAILYIIGLVFGIVFP